MKVLPQVVPFPMGHKHTFFSSFLGGPVPEPEDVLSVEEDDVDDDFPIPFPFCFVGDGMGGFLSSTTSTGPRPLTFSNLMT